MYTETEGIILKQTKTINGRKMVLLFSRKYGKISAGTSVNEKGRSKSSLAMRPFTHGKYDLYKNRETYNINNAEVIKAYYKLGEDVEKYMCASYVLEFTEKLIPEDAAEPEVFKLLLDFFDMIEARKKEYMTAVIAFQLKAIQALGMAPQIGKCVRCGATEELDYFSIEDGGVLCCGCRGATDSPQGKNKLIYEMDFDIVVVFRYFFENNLKSIEHIALNESVMPRLREIVSEYSKYHFGMKDLLSEEFLKSM